jgi:hypothetical protein
MWYPNVSDKLVTLGSAAVLLGPGVGTTLDEGDELGEGRLGTTFREGDELGGGGTGATPREGGVGSAPVGPIGVSDSVTPSDVDVGTEPDGEPMDGEGRTTGSVFLSARFALNWTAAKPMVPSPARITMRMNTATPW